MYSYRKRLYIKESRFTLFKYRKATNLKREGMIHSMCSDISAVHKTEKNETLKHDDSNQVLTSPELIKGGGQIAQKTK
jgi:hypothetical protein